MNRWFSENQKWRLSKCGNIAQWLRSSGSMTLKMQAHWHQPVSLTILQQRWAVPTFEEQQCLRLPRSQHCLIREVKLAIDQRILMIARSVIPAGHLTQQYQCIRGLKFKTIGGWFFNRPYFQRSNFEFKLFDDTDFLYCYAQPHLEQADRKLWGRRSILVIPKQKLLLTEIFMPDFDYAPLY